MALTDSVLLGAPERSTDPDVVGYAYRAPANADLPESTTDALPASAEDLGFVSEDGLAISTESDVEYIRDWNLDQVRALLTEHSATVTFQMISWTIASLKAWAGEDNVTETASEYVVRINSNMARPSAWIFNLKDNGVKRRVVLPNAVVASQGELVLRKGEQTNLEVELSPLVDGKGEKIYIYTAKPSTSTPAG